MCGCRCGIIYATMLCSAMLGTISVLAWDSLSPDYTLLTLLCLACILMRLDLELGCEPLPRDPCMEAEHDLFSGEAFDVCILHRCMGSAVLMSCSTVCLYMHVDECRLGMPW